MFRKPKRTRVQGGAGDIRVRVYFWLWASRYPTHYVPYPYHTHTHTNRHAGSTQYTGEREVQSDSAFNAVKWEGFSSARQKSMVMVAWHAHGKGDTWERSGQGGQARSFLQQKTQKKARHGGWLRRKRRAAPMVWLGGSEKGESMT